jgi:hypothetical protein
MKKLILFILFIFLINPLFALTAEEKSTINILKDLKVITKERTEKEFYEPMRTIDVMSLNIKSMSYMFDLFDEVLIGDIQYLDNRINDLQASIPELRPIENSIGLLKRENIDLKGRINDINFLLILSIILNLII